METETTRIGALRTLAIGLLLGLFAVIVLHAQSDAEKGEELFDQICISCHTWDMFEGDYRSRKGWELTVYRMQQYAVFDDDQADLIVQYLVSRDNEPEQEEPVEEEDAVVAAAANEPVGNGPASNQFVANQTTVAVAEPSGPQFQPDVGELQGPGFLFTRIWNPSQRAVRFSRWLGYLAMCCLAGLMASGAGRRVLKQRFRPVHRAAGFGLAAVVAIHAVIYFFEYGAPPVAWLVYGIVATLLVAAAFITGFWRKQLKLNYRAVHYGLGGFAAGLAGLHWLWAWI